MIFKMTTSYGHHFEMNDEEPKMKCDCKPRFQTQASLKEFYYRMVEINRELIAAKREQEKQNPFPFDDELSLSQGSPYCNANLDIDKTKDMMIRYAVINDRIYVNSEDFLKELDSTNKDNEVKYDPEVANTFLEIMMNVSNRSADLGDADPLRVKVET